MTVFVSEAVGAERLVYGTAPASPGARLRRWHRLAALYRAGLARCGSPVQPILRPEIYQAAVARQACGAEPGDWHLAVKPIEHLRPFHGLPNVFVCDWSYPSLSTAAGPGAPFLHHLRVLGNADAVACCTEATAATIRAAGLPAVHLPPPVIPEPFEETPPPVEPPAGAQTCTILAPVDGDAAPAGISALLRGFAAAHGRDDRLRLVVAVDGPVAVATLRADMLSRSGVDDPTGAVTVVAAPVDEALDRWAAGADYVLDVLPVDGFPLLSAEAARRGRSLIAPQTPFFELPAGGQIRLATVPDDADPADEPAAAVMPLRIERPDAAAIAAALGEAAALPVSARHDLAAVARAFAERHFGLAAFRAGLDRLRALHPGLQS